MSVPLDLPKLSERIKAISKTYVSGTVVAPSVDNVLLPDILKIIRGIIINTQASDPAFWESAGIRVVDSGTFNKCLEVVKENTKLLGEGYFGKVFNVPVHKCIQNKLPKDVKRVGVKVERMKPSYEPSQTPEYVRNAFLIAKKAGELKIAPAMYDSFVTIDTDGTVKIIKLFEIIDGKPWADFKWTKTSKEKAILNLQDLIHRMNAAGIIHHDLHGGNVMVTKSRQIYIIDFDLARFSKNEEKNRIASFNDDPSLSVWEPKGVASKDGVNFIFNRLLEEGSIVFDSNKSNDSSEHRKNANRGRKNSKTKKAKKSKHD